MKKHFSVFSILIILIIVTTTFSVNAATIDQNGVDLPWTSQLFKDAEGEVRNLSTAFVGANQVPMLSYSIVGTDAIRQAHRATSATPGNCGPDNSWYCFSWLDPYLLPATLSDMATHIYIDSHAIKWAYQTTGGYIRGASIERKHDMTFLTSNSADLLQISKFGATLIGTPSLQVDSGGHYEMAVTILGSGDLYPHSLVYLYYVGGSNTTCTSTGSPYRCFVIDTSLGSGSMGSPSLQISEDGNAGIAYYKSGEVMYAYPHINLPGWPSNCGTTDDPWRCISIYSGTPTGDVGKVVKLGMGDTTSQRGIAFIYDDTLIPDTLFHAEYVGSAGNCGEDLRFGGSSDYRFYCDSLIGFDHQSTQSFSIDIDPLGYSVITFDYASDDMSNRDLYIVYPNARTGPYPGWTMQKIDGASIYDVETGALAAIAINDNNMGFISYLRQEPYEDNDLRIAFQLHRSLLPVITKP
jgi:hypothetical protein